MKSDIKLLDSIPKFNIYSKCGTAIDRQFELFSLKHFIESLKDPHYSAKANNKIKNFFTEKKNQEEIDIFNDIEEKDEKLEENKSISYKIIKDKPTKMNYASIKEKIDAEMGPCKYNPNYNSIFKKIPYVKIIKPQLSAKRRTSQTAEINDSYIDNNKSAGNISVKDLEENKKLRRNKKMKSENYIQININEGKEKKNNDENSEKSSNKLPLIVKKINSYSCNKTKNHALKFSKYYERKIKLPEINDKLSYIEPINYKKIKKNNAINFSKMRERPTLLNQASLCVPNPCYYNPKYSLLEKSVRKVKLSNKPNIGTIEHRKYLLKKIFSSYYIDQSYHCIDNTKLTENIK